MNYRPICAFHWHLVLGAGVFWGLPIVVVYHNRPISTFYSELTSFAMLAVVFGLGWMSAVGQQGSPRRLALVVAAPAGFALVLFIQLALQVLQQPMATFLAIGYAVAAAMAIQLGYWLSNELLAERVLRSIACAAVLAGLFSAFAAWAQALSLEPHFAGLVAVYEDKEQRRLFANLFQANHLASVLCMGMMGVSYLLARKVLGAGTYTATTTILASAVYLTVSRMPWLQVLVVCVFGFILLDREADGGRNIPLARRLLLSSVPLLAMVCAYLIISHFSSWLDLRLDGTVLERVVFEIQKSSSRIALWRYAWQMFQEHPILGVGWGEFTIQQFWLAATLGTVGTANNAHNLVLDLLAKTGALGALLVLIPLAAWIVRVTEAILRSERYHQRSFCLGMIAVVAVHAMLEFPHTYAYFLLPVCVLLGIAETTGIRLFQRSMSTTLGATALLLLSAGIAGALLDYRRAEVTYEPNGHLRYTQNPAVVFGDWGRYGLIGLLEPNRELIDQKINMYEHALSLGPRPEYVRNYIILLVLHGDDERAMTNVVRLNAMFRVAGDQQYRLLLKMCDHNPQELGDFKAKLIQRFGNLPA